jgi:hypothetical protein
MKGFISIIVACSLIFTPVLIFASTAQQEEIKALNELSGNRDLLNLSGGNSCRQNCMPCGYMDQQVCCDTVCDDNSSSGYSGGGGGGGELSVLGWILGGALMVWALYEIWNLPGGPGGK